MLLECKEVLQPQAHANGLNSANQWDDFAMIDMTNEMGDDEFNHSLLNINQ